VSAVPAGSDAAGSAAAGCAPARAVGFVGIGNMGWPMAANLVRAGFQVAVTDAVSGRAAAFAAEIGGRACDGAAAVAAGADVLVTILPTSAHVSEVLDEAEGVLRRGSVVIDMTSGVPTVTRGLAERLAGAGVAMIDAPVSGGVGRARSGELAIMVGGQDEDIERAGPVLAAMGTSIHRCGAIGAGQATKALNNLVSAAGFLISVEALLIGQQFGIDPETMVTVLNASSGMNNTTKSKILPFVLSRRFDSGFGLDLMVKDLGIALDVGKETGTPTPFAAVCRELWAGAAGVLGPGLDHTEIARFSELLGRAELRARPAADGAAGVPA
jgi:3-hydroxyisobutyrate dehydrogenase